MDHYQEKKEQIEEFKQCLLNFVKRYDKFKVPKKTAKELIDETWPKKLGRWPEKNDWWKNKVWVQDLCRKYQYLLPVLHELEGTPKTRIQDVQDITSKTFIQEVNCENKEYDYLLIRIKDSNRDRITERIGCSERTFMRYIKGLVDCGLIISINAGSKGHYYAVGYWTEFFNKDADGEKKPGWKKNYFLNQQTVIKLRKFKPGE